MSVADWLAVAGSLLATLGVLWGIARWLVGALRDVGERVSVLAEQLRGVVAVAEERERRVDGEVAALRCRVEDQEDRVRDLEVASVEARAICPRFRGAQACEV